MDVNGKFANGDIYPNEFLHNSPIAVPWLNALFDWAVTYTGINRFRLSVIAITVMVLMYMIIFHGSTTSQMVGFVYPAFITIKHFLGIQHTPNANKPDALHLWTKWTTYWLMFALIWIFEQPFGSLLLLLAPFYNVIKTVVFIWYFVPNKNINLYYTFIHPHLVVTNDLKEKSIKETDANTEPSEAIIPWMLALFGWAATRPGMNRYRVLIGLACVMLIYTITFHGSATSAMIGFVYPAYVTYTTKLHVNPSNPAEVEDMHESTKLFAYWLLFTFIVIFERPIALLLRILARFYYVIKTAFFIWGFMPTDGTVFIYDTFVYRYIVDANEFIEPLKKSKRLGRNIK